ncbi:MAG TPA: M28 family metallopeptidase [Acidobacteriaceae bacterium]|nr:M28 family metallopeptidase [Acidobacteriaceae bacterium]
MTRSRLPILLAAIFLPALAVVIAQAVPQAASPAVFGYQNYSAEQARIDRIFLAVPSPRLAREELKILTARPHVAGSPYDHQNAEYVAGKFRAAGLETQIVPYMAWLNTPTKTLVEAWGPDGKLLMTGPTPEHVKGDPYENQPDVTPIFHGSSPSGDITAEVVYGNYCRPEDYNQLASMGVDVRGKIVLCRYGGNFRGVKVYIAQQRGAAGVLIYSDPADDGYHRGDPYPDGPWRPETGVQRGSVQYLFKYPGDALTPGIASRPELPASERLKPSQAGNMPKIPSEPLSWHDAAPILAHLGGPDAPGAWQGALPFTYHIGPGVKVHLLLRMDYQYQRLWDVIGRIPGSRYPNDWVVAGNHRDAWVFGAADPNSGTAAMLEAVHGMGTLLKTGWRPKRTIIFCSWDGEEEGLIGSTEWVEDHPAQLTHAVAYFNTDVGVSGQSFNASAVPSLKEFIRQVTEEVPSPQGGTVYDAWQLHQAEHPGPDDEHNSVDAAHVETGVRIGDLGSGSDYTPFLQHIGVPSTDIGSDGPYGVYHSTFDDYTWFVMNADPHFLYEQEMARVFGLEVLHMADADVLPYDYVTYGKELSAYLQAAQKKAEAAGMTDLDFAPAEAAARQFTQFAGQVTAKQQNPGADSAAQLASLNDQLRAVEGDFIAQQGLPGRPWFKHVIYAPGEYTGYAAVVIPGVNEAIDAKDLPRAQEQMTVLTAAIRRAARTLQEAAEQALSVHADARLAQAPATPAHSRSARLQEALRRTRR